MNDFTDSPKFTEELLLEKCNGDYEAAARLAAAIVIVMEERYKITKELSDPEGPHMKSLLKKIDEDLEWDLDTQWWRKVIPWNKLIKKAK